MMVQIGDVVPWDAPPSLFQDGLQQWYALRCPPLRESHAVAWLRERAVSAFYSETRHKVTIRGKAIERRRLVLPGYIFARFPGDPVWHRVLDYDNPARRIVDVLCLASGEPGRLHEDDLHDLRALAAREKDDVEQSHRAAIARVTAKVGDVVRHPILGDDGHEVVEITGRGGVKVKLTLFGSERVVELDSGFQKVVDPKADAAMVVHTPV